MVKSVSSSASTITTTNSAYSDSGASTDTERPQPDPAPPSGGAHTTNRRFPFLRKMKAAFGGSRRDKAESKETSDVSGEAREEKKPLLNIKKIKTALKNKGWGVSVKNVNVDLGVTYAVQETNNEKYKAKVPWPIPVEPLRGPEKPLPPLPLSSSASSEKPLPPLPSVASDESASAVQTQPLASAADTLQLQATASGEGEPKSDHSDAFNNAVFSTEPDAFLKLFGPDGCFGDPALHGAAHTDLQNRLKELSAKEGVTNKDLVVIAYTMSRTLGNNVEKATAVLDYLAEIDIADSIKTAYEEGALPQTRGKYDLETRNLAWRTAQLLALSKDGRQPLGLLTRIDSAQEPLLTTYFRSSKKLLDLGGDRLCLPEVLLHERGNAPELLHKGLRAAAERLISNDMDNHRKDLTPEEVDRRSSYSLVRNGNTSDEAGTSVAMAEHRTNKFADAWIPRLNNSSNFLHKSPLSPISEKALDYVTQGGISDTKCALVVVEEFHKEITDRNNHLRPLPASASEEEKKAYRSALIRDFVREALAGVWQSRLMYEKLDGNELDPLEKIEAEATLKGRLAQLKALSAGSDDSNKTSAKRFDFPASGDMLPKVDFGETLDGLSILEERGLKPWPESAAAVASHEPVETSEYGWAEDVLSTLGFKTTRMPNQPARHELKSAVAHTPVDISFEELSAEFERQIRTQGSAEVYEAWATDAKKERAIRGADWDWTTFDSALNGMKGNIPPRPPWPKPSENLSDQELRQRLVDILTIAWERINLRSTLVARDGPLGGLTTKNMGTHTIGLVQKAVGLVAPHGGLTLAMGSQGIFHIGLSGQGAEIMLLKKYPRSVNVSGGVFAGSDIKVARAGGSLGFVLGRDWASAEGVVFRLDRTGRPPRGQDKGRPGGMYGDDQLVKEMAEVTAVLIKGVTDEERAQGITPFKKLLATFPDTLSVTCLSRQENAEKVDHVTGVAKAGLVVGAGKFAMSLPSVFSAIQNRWIKQSLHESSVEGVALDRRVEGTDARISAGIGLGGATSHRLSPTRSQGIGSMEGLNYAIDLYHKGETKVSTILVVNDEVAKNSHNVTNITRQEDFTAAIHSRFYELSNQLAKRRIQTYEKKLGPASRELKNEFIRAAQQKILRFLKSVEERIWQTQSFVQFEEFKQEAADKVNLCRAISKIAATTNDTVRVQSMDKIRNDVLLDPRSWDLNYLLVGDTMDRAKDVGLNAGLFGRRRIGVTATHLNDFIVLR